jgi:hypothetical protein
MKDFLVPLLLVLLFASCKPDDDNPVDPPIVETDSLALLVDTWWQVGYETYLNDTAHNSETFSVDSASTYTFEDDGSGIEGSTHQTGQTLFDYTFQNDSLSIYYRSNPGTIKTKIDKISEDSLILSQSTTLTSKVIYRMARLN